MQGLDKNIIISYVDKNKLILSKAKAKAEAKDFMSSF